MGVILISSQTKWPNWLLCRRRSSCPMIRFVVSPFAPEALGVTYWQNFINLMAARGVKVAFIPCFLNYEANVAAFAPISYGFSNWGNRSPAANQNLATNINDAHSRGKIWMQPVSVQDTRPYTAVYDEANNTENLRVTWNAAISYGADWVQIPTWNDYSENTQISPSTHIGWGPLDLMSYYLTRWKTGGGQLSCAIPFMSRTGCSP